MQIGHKTTDPSGSFAVQILVNGHLTPMYRRLCDGKVFVEGTPGATYMLVVHNLTTARLEVVAAVDQRDTLTDAQANINFRGMLAEPGGITTFDGWRRNDREVGAFVFGEPERSIAAQATDSTAGTGIIGFAVFTQQGLVYRQDHDDTRHTMGDGPKGAAPSGSLGTGIGGTIASPVTRVQFTRSTLPPAILEIGYDTLERLEAMGLTGPAEPAAFPAYDAFSSYTRTS